MKKMEILSPAGDTDCLIQAINNGADAIYLGAKSFNARGKVSNFDDEELKKVVKKAHLFNVKIYLTVNTIVFDSEITDAINQIKIAKECGVDAFILQDLGIIQAIKEQHLEIEMHASTQLAVNNLQGALVLEKLGFSRVVLSRECGIEEIKQIKQNTNLEIEYFVQGALCVCFSGNCYLSGMLNSASGNRGKCLQLCRLPYTATKNGKVLKTGYLLSAKDNNLSEHLKELSDAGVDSLKIEGRARRAGYVAIATATYRQIVDNNFKVTQQNITNLSLAFNRGDFTPAYLNGNGSIIDNNIQGHRGIEIGKVVKINKGNKFNQIFIKSNYEIGKNDGLKIIKDNIEISSFSAMDIIKQKDLYVVNTKALASVGDNVNLILSNNLETQFLNKQKKLKIDIEYNAFAGEYPILTLKHGNSVCTVVGENLCEEAKTAPTSVSDIKNQLSKLGESVFVCENITVNANNLFLRKQDLNALRNQAVMQLENIIIDNYNNSHIKQAVKRYDSLQNISKYTKPQMAVIINENSNYDVSEFDKVILKPTVYNENVISKMLEGVSCNEKYLYVPPMLSTMECKIIANLLSKFNLSVYSTNLSGFSFNKEVFVSPLQNVANSKSIDLCASLGAKDICVSSELSFSQMEELSLNKNANIFIYAKGNFPVMTLKHCPMKNNFGGKCENCNFDSNIKYEMQSGNSLLLRRYKIINCYFNLLNNKEINLEINFNNININYIIDKTN